MLMIDDILVEATGEMNTMRSTSGKYVFLSLGLSFNYDIYLVFLGSFALCGIPKIVENMAHLFLIVP